jgi:hypothetical protein
MSKLVYLSKLFLIISQFLILALIVLLFGFTLTTLIKPDLLADYTIAFSTNSYRFDIAKCVACEETSNVIKLTSLSTSMLLQIWLKATIYLALLAGIIRQLLKVLNNFHSLKTFYEENIISFRKVGFMCLVIGFITSFNYVSYYNTAQNQNFDFMSFSFPFKAIAFALASFILAEVFKEGKLLLEDKESIL